MSLMLSRWKDTEIESILTQIAHASRLDIKNNIRDNCINISVIIPE